MSLYLNSIILYLGSIIATDTRFAFKMHSSAYDPQ